MRGPSRVSLAVPCFTQRDAECGNTSLKAALAHLGLRFSARRLGQLAGTNEEGTEHANLIEAARRCGVAVFARSGGAPGRSLAELRGFLRRGLPAIIGWWSRAEGAPHFDPRWTLAERRAHDSGHFSLITGTAPGRVLLTDPEARLVHGRWRAIGRRWMSDDAFLRVWYDTDTPKFRYVARWYMVAHRSAQRFAAELGAGRDFSPAADAARAPRRRLSATARLSAPR